MPDDTITLVSTTDTPEQVQAALGVVTPPPAEAPPAAAPATPPTAPPAAPPTDEDEPPAPPPADETPEQRDARETQEASEAGRRLAARRQKFQSEMDALTRRKHDLRRDVEAEEARLEALRQQRPPTEPPADAPVAAAPPADAAAAKGESRPEPELEDKDTTGKAKYGNYEEYLSDHGKWVREEAVRDARRIVEAERLADRERIERESANRVVTERVAAYTQSLEALKKTHADFDAAFEEATEAVRDTLVAIGPQALKIVDGFTVFDSEDGAALTYYLVKHPDELKAIAMKAPQQQLVHLARLDERLRSGTAPKKAGTSPTAVPETRAPEPIKPVGSGPTATTVTAPDEANYQDFKAWRERDLRKRRGVAS